MTSKIPHSTGLIEEAADFKAVAVYEPGTGKIVHMHVVKVFQGGRAVSEQEALETANKEAKRLGHDMAKLRTKVSTDSKHAMLPHRIDIKSGDFVALPSEIGALLTSRPR